MRRWIHIICTHLNLLLLEQLANLRICERSDIAISLLLKKLARSAFYHSAVTYKDNFLYTQLGFEEIDLLGDSFRIRRVAAEDSN